VLIQLLIRSLVIGSVYGLIALGYSMIYSASGLLTFVQGDFLMLGAFLGMTFYKTLDLPYVVSLFATVIIMFGFGLLIERFIIRKLQKAGANMIFVVLASIALSIILQNMAQFVWGSTVYQFPPIFSVSRISIGRVQIEPESIMAIVVALIFMYLLHVFLTRTRFGTAMRAAAQDPLAARTMAINVSLTNGVTWGISAALAGVAGMLAGPVYGVHMGMGIAPGLKGFIGAIMGGYGNMYGAIVGSLSLGIIENVAAGYFTSLYRDAVSFGILVLFLIFLPRGLLKAQVYGE